jgi:mono/diheme cytochrome c family protein
MEYSRIEDPSDPSGNKFVSNQRVVKFYVWVGNPKNRGIQRVTSADLDGFGARPVPQLCAVCHGGHYEGPRRKDGTPDWSPTHGNLHSNLIAFDFRSLTTPKIVLPPATTPVDFKATQQATFKRLNKDMVLASLPGRPIRSLIERMYPGSEVNQNENVQVPGWKKKTGSPSDRDVYRDVVAPSCRTCHYSQDSSDDPTPTKTVLDWDQSSELGQRAAETAIFVCTAQLMPHALITHRRFWLSDAPKQKRILRAFLLDHKVAPANVKTCR